MRAFSFLSCFLAVTTMAHANPSQSGSHKLVGGHMVFAVGYGTLDQSMNNYVLIGNYIFDGQSFVAEYNEFDANANIKPKKTDMRHNLKAAYGKHGCEDKIIDIPTASAERSVKGSWQTDGKILKLISEMQTYEWELEDGDEGRYKLRSVRDNTINQNFPLTVGFAYISTNENTPKKLRKENFLSYYQGEIYHKNNNAFAKTPWHFKPSGLKISVFQETKDGNVLSYSSAGTMESNGAWIGNSILLNHNKKSNNIIYQDLGHDFNKNGCYDEFGHNKVIFAAYNKVKPLLIRNMVYIEYSYTFDGFPMISVGHYYR